MRLLLLQFTPQSWYPVIVALPELSLFAIVIAAILAVIGVKRDTHDFNLLALISLGYGMVPFLHYVH